MNRVRDYQRTQKLSQITLIEKLVSRQTINLIKNSEYNPSLDLCLKSMWIF
ncbi:helix-turn-helix transcriptional regulator [Companilactobacillus alimentarius]|uniref:Transcriptional regulator n=1 Tax=Companilactobacillus alimentarius DSM 20249 TaxID=1423720 RepID=A0A2K9HI15_9LACO|nr:transcriptional regulator [Companilactobacillus alimentarius]AUI72190.1 transcriptional regulator [Companilactobacillus alimentarius DSM 20249]MDT6952733.1 transcriptional regulator [Companilactobacillus alimentarius]MDT6952758.1 transcriptional regulator [Companilactobacillus alimentarius]